MVNKAAWKLPIQSLWLAETYLSLHVKCWILLDFNHSCKVSQMLVKHPNIKFLEKPLGRSPTIDAYEQMSGVILIRTPKVSESAQYYSGRI